MSLLSLFQLQRSSREVRHIKINWRLTSVLWLLRIMPLLSRTGSAIKNRWNWLNSRRKKDLLDFLVSENRELFRQILQVQAAWLFL